MLVTYNYVELQYFFFQYGFSQDKLVVQFSELRTSSTPLKIHTDERMRLL